METTPSEIRSMDRLNAIFFSAPSGWWRCRLWRKLPHLPGLTKVDFAQYLINFRVMTFGQDHKVSVIVRIMACLALAMPSCDRTANESVNELRDGAGTRSPDRNATRSKKEMLDNQINATGFASFEAVDLPLAAVLSMVEDKFNSQWSPAGVDRVRFSAINSPNERITIVLKRIDLRTLIGLIEKQTLYQHRVDYDRREIMFLSIGDAIGDDIPPVRIDGNPKGDGEPTVLPVK